MKLSRTTKKYTKRFPQRLFRLNMATCECRSLTGGKQKQEDWHWITTCYCFKLSKTCEKHVSGDESCYKVTGRWGGWLGGWMGGCRSARALHQNGVGNTGNTGSTGKLPPVYNTKENNKKQLFLTKDLRFKLTRSVQLVSGTQSTMCFMNCVHESLSHARAHTTHSRSVCPIFSLSLTYTTTWGSLSDDNEGYKAAVLATVIHGVYIKELLQTGARMPSRLPTYPHSIAGEKGNISETN